MMRTANPIAQVITNHANTTIASQSATAFESHSPITTFQPFTVGPQGNFPYYWQDPRTLQFNAKTYNWIDSSLKANTHPTQLGPPFSNLFISAISKVNYSLSQADQDKLNHDRNQILNQQTALLQAWKAAFGHLPSPSSKRQTIDKILNRITQTWAAPPVSLTDLQHNPNAEKLLNKTPLKGWSVIPMLVNYLNALGAGMSLLNAVTMNDAYLHNALLAVQRADAANGGLETNDGSMHPAYVVNTPLQEILKGLNARTAKQAFSVTMQVTESSNDEWLIKSEQAPPVHVPNQAFLSIETIESNELFKGQFLTPKQDVVDLRLDFSGLTTVYFSPVNFSMPLLKYWYWTQPIRDAIQNGDDDISGFKFSPKPQIDFSKSGPFGFLYAVAISKHPTITLKTKQSSDQITAQLIDNTGAVKVKFLGQTLGADDGPNYSISVVNKYRNDAVIDIELKPLKNHVGACNATAYVHGVLAEYPAA